MGSSLDAEIHAPFIAFLAVSGLHNRPPHKPPTPYGRDTASALFLVTCTVPTLPVAISCTASSR